MWKFARWALRARRGGGRHGGVQGAAEAAREAGAARGFSAGDRSIEACVRGHEDLFEDAAEEIARVRRSGGRGVHGEEAAAGDGAGARCNLLLRTFELHVSL